MEYCFRFPLKMTSCVCFFGSGLKLIFHWKAHLFISIKFYSVQEQRYCYYGSQETRTYRQHSLAFEENPSDKSLIHIKNNNGPRIEPWGTPALTSDQSEAGPFNTTLCFLFLRKSHKRFSKLPDIQLCFNLNMKL